MTESKKKSNAKYRKKVKTLLLEFYPTEKDAELLEHLAKQESKQGYIKNLIREDMEK